MNQTLTLVHEYWIIRHKITRVILPARVLATKYDFASPDHREPRLFRKEHTARACAAAWAKGAWYTPLDQDGDWESGYVNYRGTPTYKTVTGRSIDDLEIVAITLNEPT